MTTDTQSNSFIFTAYEAERLGNNAARIFKLRQSKEYKDRFETEWGTKTAQGLGYSIIRLVEQRGEDI